MARSVRPLLTRDPSVLTPEVAAQMCATVRALPPIPPARLASIAELCARMDEDARRDRIDARIREAKM